MQASPSASFCHAAKLAAAPSVRPVGGYGNSNTGNIYMSARNACFGESWKTADVSDTTRDIFLC